VGRTVTGGGRVPGWVRAAHQFLFYRDEQASAEKSRGQFAATLKSYIFEEGEETPEGHLEVLFPEPLNIGGVRYLGLRNQRTNPAPLLDEDRAQELLDQLGLRDRVAEEVTVTQWNWDELYVLNQQGLITDEQLDSLFDEPEPKWSLVVIR
jgi:hypothetical protein